MRETTLLAIAVVAASFGMGLGCERLSKKTVTTSALATPAPVIRTARAAPVAQVTPLPAPPEPVNANSTPEAIHAWRRQAKDEIVQRVEALTTAEAEHLCFLLQLIPRDEVFDKINVKGRLKRCVNDMYFDEQLTEVETAFRELKQHP